MKFKISKWRTSFSTFSFKTSLEMNWAHMIFGRNIVLMKANSPKHIQYFLDVHLTSTSNIIYVEQKHEIGMVTDLARFQANTYLMNRSSASV